MNKIIELNSKEIPSISGGEGNGTAMAVLLLPAAYFICKLCVDLYRIHMYFNKSDKFVVLPHSLKKHQQILPKKQLNLNRATICGNYSNVRLTRTDL